MWHVDDLKVSHVNAAVNTEVIEMIKKEFGKEAPLTVNRGKIHDYLGMTLDFTEDGKVDTPYCATREVFDSLVVHFMKLFRREFPLFISHKYSPSRELWVMRN